MRSLNSIILLSFILLVLTTKAGYSQLNGEDEFERMMPEEPDVKNSFYKPVIAFGIGTLNYLGDVNDFYSSMFGTRPGYRLNVSTFIDNTRNYKMNFFLLYGNLSGNERSYTNLERNLNFESEVINFGINVEYTFNHFFRAGSMITPFISIGAESFQFNSKADLYNSQGIAYNYWSDGTIRNMPENSPNSHESIMIQRDYIYETDLRSANLYGMGDYPQMSLAIPVDYGLDFKITERVIMRLGSSIHFAFTDLVDNLSSETSTIKASKKKDRFSYTYVTFHLDLFSDAKTMVVERLMRDADFDYTMIEDKDNDGIFDFWDNCPDTPPGVEVDEFGCPVDSDQDGVPDYIDQEPNSRPGAFVDNTGKEITREQLIAMLGKSDVAIDRTGIDLPGTSYAYTSSRYSDQNYTGIPAKYRFLDSDGDGFISFGELIRAIDIFFDGESDLTVEDIYDLNSFFFSQ